ncbi:hypothetical protein [uncultured Nevskia sp.]|uniref:hypothetical protein n=1 Tax=uncultured Nevskia sp. TaxID=228950 RepID=UPI0025E8C871|nr:hypothetical protein [uncultured Nevskia sp.]
MGLKKMKFILLAGALLAPLAASAADRCSTKQAQAAEEATDQMKTWSAIYSGFKSFHHCDDGGIAEGFTEAVVHLLASDWRSVGSAASLSTKDKAFSSFLLKHINASANTEELQNIASTSGAQCPPELSSVCEDIHRAATLALEEAAQ